MNRIRRFFNASIDNADGGPPVFRQQRAVPVPVLLLMFAVWLAITWATPYFNAVVNLRRVDPWLPPAIRMLLILLTTWLVAYLWDDGGLGAIFNLSTRRLGSALGWAIAFAALALVVEKIYEWLILGSFLNTSSKSPGTNAVPAISRRIFESFYIVLEGVVESLVFVGFLIDRLAKRYGWTFALILGNAAFALWHFGYWKAGLLEGSLLIGMVFVIGSAVALSYKMTKNCLSPIIAHTLVDAPGIGRVLFPSYFA